MARRIPILLGYGLPEKVLIDARNPGFYDPFHPIDDITLVNYRGWFVGKLDWVLLRGLGVIHREIGNHDFSASDHKWMLVDVSLNKEDATKSFIQKKEQQNQRRRNSKLILYGLVIFILAVIIYMIY